MCYGYFGYTHMATTDNPLCTKEICFDSKDPCCISDSKFYEQWLDRQIWYSFSIFEESTTYGI